MPHIVSRDANKKKKKKPKKICPKDQKQKKEKAKKQKKTIKSKKNSFLNSTSFFSTQHLQPLEIHIILDSRI